MRKAKALTAILVGLATGIAAGHLLRAWAHYLAEWAIDDSTDDE